MHHENKKAFHSEANRPLSQVNNLSRFRRGGGPRVNKFEEVWGLRPGGPMWVVEDRARGSPQVNKIEQDPHPCKDRHD